MRDGATRHASGHAQGLRSGWCNTDASIRPAASHVDISLLQLPLSVGGAVVGACAIIIMVCGMVCGTIVLREGGAQLLVRRRGAPPGAHNDARGDQPAARTLR